MRVRLRPQSTATPIRATPNAASPRSAFPRRPHSTVSPSSSSEAAHDYSSAETGLPPPTFIRSDGDVSRDFGGGFVQLDGGAAGGAGTLAGRDSEKESIKEELKESTRTKSVPRMDELNTLLRHPTLYDPVLVPRFPIVLCHGLYGFDVRGPTFFRLHYWGDLLKILRGKVGAEVFVTAVPGTGAVKQRAHVLHQSLEEIPGVLGRDLNFIGHSMGGLDARYLISTIRPTTYRPRSLTTLSTPHRGSEFMSWCRANIGIGTDFDKTSEAVAKAIYEDTTSYPLPYSLRAPILSRSAQVERKKELELVKRTAQAEVEKVKAGGISLPGLPNSLSVALSGYLLDLLDSPAYANLTPSFLSDVFNPSTPDDPNVKYYSVAARTEKIGIWHPLWLPKMVLDGAAEARVANGMEEPPKEFRGNDGLVTVESAKWGEFLGTLEACDHWELRGSSGLIGDMEKGLMGNLTKGGSMEEKAAQQRVVDKGRWRGWQDVYKLVGMSKEGKEKNETERETKAKMEATATTTTTTAGVASGSIPAATLTPNPTQADEAKGLALLASWISRRLPAADSSSETIHLPAPPSSSPPPTPAASPPPSPATAATDSARMLYGAPQSSAKDDKFNLERLALALCRKLNQEGL